MQNVQKVLLAATFIIIAACGTDLRSPPSGTPSSKKAPTSAAEVFYELDIEGRTVLLELTPNDSVQSKDYREYMATDSGLEQMPAPAQTPNCMYRGRASWADGGKSSGPAWSALNTCDGFQGMIAIDGETWIIAPGSAHDEVLLSRMSEQLAARPTAVTIRRSAGPVDVGPEDAVAGQAEALTLTTPSKYLELVIVNDAARFEELGLDAPAESLQIASLVDAIYRNGTLSPSIAIVVTANIVIPGGTDPWPVPATGEVDSATLLANFTSWTQVPGHLRFFSADDYALLTQREMVGLTIGLAEISSACTTRKDAVVQATLTQAQVATALAHELGHTLGMNHDDFTCPGSYVMSPQLSAPPATTWSSCSAAALAQYLAKPISQCLNNVAVSHLVPTCGDGVRDPGEQCDCGSNDCTGFDPCCSGSTCRLIAGAACSALDGCCNACHIAPEGTTCEAGTACTPAATCSGVSSTCYKPAPLANGTACTVATFGDGRCFQGDCQSRSEQCDTAYAGATACPTSASASCTDLSCTLPDHTGCALLDDFYSGNGLLQVRDGSGCGNGALCHQGACVPSVTVPVCESGLPVNECGGCSSLATQPGIACNTCGITECVSAGEVECNVASPSLCPTWVAGDFSACSASCGGGTQTRGVTCQNSSGSVVPDAQCATAGSKPATQQTCNLDPCITYEWLVGSFDACSVACGDGVQSRPVVCVESGTTTVVADSFCTTPKPASTEPCSPVCNTGYSCMAGTCAPINACDMTPCAVGQVCTSTGPGTYSCADLDECGSNNGACDARVTCTNTTGGRTCGALDACHPAYLCPAATASCPVTAVADGTSCSDQNACTQTDVCIAGACVGSNPVVCTAAAVCQLPGTCNPKTGSCGAPVPNPSCAHCSDHIKNSGETGVDCGGSQCLACKDAACIADAECASGYCKPLKKGSKKPGECE